MKTSLLRYLAIIILIFFYVVTALVSNIFSLYRRPFTIKKNKLLVIGTFHNPNWFHAHVTPLTQAGFDSVILITDEKLDDLENLVYECPPVIMQKLLTRALAKFIWTIYCGYKYKPDLYMGYHIFPAAISALVVARLLNRPACFQDTSGPLELEGGGWNAENRLLTSLGGPSKLVEAAVNLVVRRFDLIVVRGSGSKYYIRKIGYKNTIATITGSVMMPSKLTPILKRDIDIVFVGRLTEYKRPDRCIEVLSQVKTKLPKIRAILIGDGPDKQALEQRVSNLGLLENVTFLGQRKDVPVWLAKSKIYLLTSRWEGVSIAMLEAMGNGVVPIVSNVGDLTDYVINNETGYVHDGDDIDGYSESIVSILDNDKELTRLSRQCIDMISTRSSRSAVASKWQLNLGQVISNYK